MEILKIKDKNTGQWINIPALKGEKGDTGTQGPIGPKGEDGKTPVKGTDYWTAADKTEIVNETKNSISLNEYVKSVNNTFPDANGNVNITVTAEQPEFIVKDTMEEALAWLNENGDTSKTYVLPDGYLYRYMTSTTTYDKPNCNNLFVKDEAMFGYRVSSANLVKVYAGRTLTNIIPVNAGETYDIRAYKLLGVEAILEFSDIPTLIEEQVPTNFIQKTNGLSKTWESPNKLTCKFTHTMSSTTKYILLDTFASTEADLQNGIITLNEPVVLGTTPVTEETTAWTNTKIRYIVSGSSYTNVLPTALDATGNAVYNGAGYKADTRWSSSNGVEAAYAGAYLTGYIPVENGDIIRLKNIKMLNEEGNNCVVWCYSDFNVANYEIRNTGLASRNPIWDKDNNLTQFTLDVDCKYIRLQGSYMGSDSIVTVNEEIIETDDTRFEEIYTELDNIEVRLEALENQETEGTNIPYYWQPHLDEQVDAIRERMELAGRNKSSFLFYSDAHWDDGSKQSPVLLNYLFKHTPINKTLFGGDIVSVEPTTETLSDRTIMEYLWNWRSQIRDLKHYSVIGNHDDGNSNTETGGHNNSIFTTDYVYSFLFAPEEDNRGIVRDADTYYYFDDTREKTRYLCLDTAYEGSVTLSADQESFIKTALKTTPDNWHIIVLSHIWYGPDYDRYSERPVPIKGMSNPAKAICTILDSYNDRNDEFADCGAKVEFCIGGHVHYDYVGNTKVDDQGNPAGGIPIILCETASLNWRGNFQATTGNITETAVSGIIADYNNDKVNIVRVGRGNSFEVNLSTGIKTDILD